MIHKHSLQERGDTWEGSMLLIKSGIKRSPHYTVAFWKRSFISTVIPPFALIRHKNGAFWKRCSNRRNLTTAALCFSVDRKHFENEAVRQWWRHDNNVISLPQFSSNKSKMAGDYYVFKFLWRSVDWVLNISSELWVNECVKDYTLKQFY